MHAFGKKIRGGWKCRQSFCLRMGEAEAEVRNE